jgi:hypothetical protein
MTYKQPRELSAASERLNKMIAWRWKNAAAEVDLLASSRTYADVC